MIFKGFAPAAGPRFTKANYLKKRWTNLIFIAPACMLLQDSWQTKFSLQEDWRKTPQRSHGMLYDHHSMCILGIDNDHPHPDNIHDTNLSTSGPHCGDELLSSYQSCTSTSPVPLLHPRCGVVLSDTPKPRSHAVGFAIIAA